LDHAQCPHRRDFWNSTKWKDHAKCIQRRDCWNSVKLEDQGACGSACSEDLGPTIGLPWLQAAPALFEG